MTWHRPGTRVGRIEARIGAERGGLARWAAIAGAALATLLLIAGLVGAVAGHRPGDADPSAFLGSAQTREHHSGGSDDRSGSGRSSSNDNDRGSRGDGSDKSNSDESGSGKHRSARGSGSTNSSDDSNSSGSGSTSSGSSGSSSTGSGSSSTGTDSRSGNSSSTSTGSSSTGSGSTSSGSSGSGSTGSGSSSSGTDSRSGNSGSTGTGSSGSSSSGGGSRSADSNSTGSGSSNSGSGSGNNSAGAGTSGADDNGGMTCTKLLTNVASLASILSGANPNDVICFRGRSEGNGTQRTGGGSTSGPAKQLRIWLTGYSWQDNTPPGSAKVSQPVLHQQAGGQGTFDDPITVAIPGKGGGIWKAGAKFYLPTVQRYVIVEDTGASAAPSGQDGHLDMWIGGQGGTRSATDACMNKITATNVPAELNPPPDRPVLKGPIYADNRCNIPDSAPRNDGTSDRSRRGAR